ncbi:hypothetical protein BFP75_13955 [Maribacter sp. 4G9]|nr:hypothetical protein BFP75_13955 [Maribacter sp. 4G9]
MLSFLLLNFDTERFGKGAANPDIVCYFVFILLELFLLNNFQSESFSVSAKKIPPRSPKTLTF